MIDPAEVIDEPEVEELEEVEQPEGDAPDETVNDEATPEDTALVVEIGGEEEDEGAPEWVKNVRRENRELKKKLKEVEAGNVTVPGINPLPEKPTLEGCDYDAAEFEARLTEWHEAKREHDAVLAEQNAQQERAAQRWEAKVTMYEEGKSKLGAPDFDDAEATVAEIFAKPFPGIMASDVRMGIIKQGAKDPTTLVYALGRNPERAKALAEIDDPVEFAFALGELSGTMKVVRTSKAPAPEKRISGGSAPGVTTTNDRTLDRLREEAAKTGDYSKVVQYKRQLKG